MNPLPPNADELVSAYLDGEAAPDEVAIVESNSELMARVEELRSVVEQLSSPPPASEGLKDSQIGAALDLFDELFAESAEPTASTPGLSAVPDQPEPAVAHDDSAPREQPAVAHDDSAPREQPGVASLQAARERRSRRFSPGVIAAAVAMVVLFVAAAALSFGRGNSAEDVATSAADGAVMTESLDSAMDDAEAMEEEAEPELGTSALSEVEGSAPAPAAEAPNAAEAGARAEDVVEADADMDEAMDDAEAMDDDEAMEDETVDEEEAFAASDTDQADTDQADTDQADTDQADAVAPFAFLGEFDNRVGLQQGLELGELAVPLDELLEGAVRFEDGIEPSCIDQVAELVDTEPSQLFAEALLADEGFVITEIYTLTTADDTRDIYVVDSLDCSVISILEDR